MKTLIKMVHKLGLLSALLATAFGCSESTPVQAAADARAQAADARAEVVSANARVTAADAHVRAAEADARVTALTEQRTETPIRARATIPSGTVLKVFLIDAIDSDTSAPGDRFLASLAESVVVNGETLLPSGTKIRGRVINAEGAGKVKGRSFINLELTDILRSNNRMTPITTESFSATGESTQTRDAEVIAGGAGVGAIIGAIAGGKKGAAIGAIVGGGAGTGVVLETKGKEIHYYPETRLEFALTTSVPL